jgi:hypothetical protein
MKSFFPPKQPFLLWFITNKTDDNHGFMHYKNELHKTLAQFLIYLHTSHLGWEAGLPDFYWYNIPKREKNIPNNHNIYQMVTKYTK